MECLQGEGGIRPMTLEFATKVRELCTKEDALMIVDEVQTGMGRTGKLWGYQQFANLEPDVITSAKALGGGVPIGAMLCKNHCNVFQPGDHASTYGGNPLACAAGVAVSQVFTEEKIVEKVDEIGEIFRRLAREQLQQKYPTIIQEVRGWGLINGIEISSSSTLTAADVTKALMEEERVLVVPAGPKVIRFVPPLIITKEIIQQVIEKVDRAFGKLLQPK
jgi:acetylornithine/N-succinyldiaminopimelate aminotransferase